MRTGRDDDIKFMRRCLDLAGKAEGMTYPNPVVGSVLVNDGIIIGEGYHLKAGDPHAEVNAISSVRDKKLLGSSSLYVNLEPCSHTGKTPPCADLIISGGIKKVIIGTTDTSGKVSGKGIAKLRDAGCEVVTGVLEKECRWINRRFFTFNEKKRPYIILKWAQSADGFLDADRSQEPRPVWITGNAERVLVHKWRTSEQSILVGAGTLRADNPKLNVRYWTGKDPLRFILSGSGLLDSQAAVFNINGTNVVFTYNADAKIANAKIVKLNVSRSAALQICDYLFSNDIQSLLIEGGAQVLGHFISAGLWDEARIFYGKDYFKSGIKAPEVTGVIISQAIFSRSSLKILVNEAD
jgi:diaminohydroxyphosphoribosylaminopyrimidine deaminase/5-amino-6-(5-phosphoribosylamino)uracil reductase